MSRILITGASGMVGTRLTELLLKRGHEVSHLG
ncbi:MAG TPA: NAD-dependent epimerase/dehydratase family protein, partial [Cyclobacteriaceae bacterium]|nr:NAD-dependent epimerase/dehydratase family protein [Cyclobacteriaceae bacterium]